MPNPERLLQSMPLGSSKYIYGKPVVHVLPTVWIVDGKECTSLIRAAQELLR